LYIDNKIYLSALRKDNVSVRISNNITPVHSKLHHTGTVYTITNNKAENLGDIECTVPAVKSPLRSKNAFECGTFTGANLLLELVCACTSKLLFDLYNYMHKKIKHFQIFQKRNQLIAGKQTVARVNLKLSGSLHAGYKKMLFGKQTYSKIFPCYLVMTIIILMCLKVLLSSHDTFLVPF